MGVARALWNRSDKLQKCSTTHGNIAIYLHCNLIWRLQFKPIACGLCPLSAFDPTFTAPSTTPSPLTLQHVHYIYIYICPAVSASRFHHHNRAQCVNVVTVDFSLWWGWVINPKPTPQKRNREIHSNSSMELMNLLSRINTDNDVNVKHMRGRKDLTDVGVAWNEIQRSGKEKIHGSMQPIYSNKESLYGPPLTQINALVKCSPFPKNKIIRNIPKGPI